MTTNLRWHWLEQSHGVSPSVRWSFTTEAELRGLHHSIETGHTYACDATGGIYRFDRTGRLDRLTRGTDALSELKWSQTGNGGVGLVGGDQLCRIDADLTREWTRPLKQAALAVAVSPFGYFIAVSLESGITRLFRSNGDPVTRFRTEEPLCSLAFLPQRAALLGLSRMGWLGEIDPSTGEIRWETRLEGRTSQLELLGNGEALLIANPPYGVQIYETNGERQGLIQVEGTVDRIATGFFPQRLTVGTIEQVLLSLSWEGELDYGVQTPERLAGLLVEPRGKTITCGFESGLIGCLSFDES